VSTRTSFERGRIGFRFGRAIGPCPQKPDYGVTQSLCVAPVGFIGCSWTADVARSMSAASIVSSSSRVGSAMEESRFACSCCTCSKGSGRPVRPRRRRLVHGYKVCHAWWCPGPHGSARAGFLGAQRGFGLSCEAVAACSDLRTKVDVPWSERELAAGPLSRSAGRHGRARLKFADRPEPEGRASALATRCGQSFEALRRHGADLTFRGPEFDNRSLPDGRLKRKRKPVGSCRSSN